tara:strand:- start:533 stop:1180 length:648 start_codon:yes stop_codon:yes gene_type:complete
MDFVKDIVVSLAEGIPVWLRSTFIILIILIGGMWALGFNYQNIRDILFLNDVRKNSILLSKRSSRDGDKVVKKSAKKLYSKLCSENDLIGVSVISFEPEIQPKVLKVIARDGNRDFEKTIQVGSERYLSGGAKSLFISNREGMTFMTNISKNKILQEIGVESAVSIPIIYRNICVGSFVLFFIKHIEEISDDEYEYITGSVKIEIHQILEDLYYK